MKTMLLRTSESAVWFCLAALCLGNGLRAAETPSLEIVRDGFPRALHFRAAPEVAKDGRLTYEGWDRRLMNLDGIIAKSLDEELPDTMEVCSDHLLRFKRAHPEGTGAGARGGLSQGLCAARVGRLAAQGRSQSTACHHAQASHDLGAA
jgi:hypothetical protein